LSLTKFQTEADTWKEKIDLLLPRTLEFFFPDGTAVEPACEFGGTCTTDMLSFKGFLHRWLQSTAYLASYTSEQITPILKTSAQSAVNQCTGGTNGRMCGFKWSSGSYDGTTGACQQMSVLASLISLLPTPGTGILTNTTGGTSKGDPNAGSDLDSHFTALADITTADRAGAGILTVIFLGMGLGAYVWMSV
jgi:mannan endo-1,6-alpha-mannosidase